MGAGCFFGSMLVLALFFRPLACQEPNTDGFFVAEFLKNMGLRSSPLHNYSAPVCSWRGVFCDDGRLVKFLASGLGLSGTIPDNTIGKLSMLQVLDLSNNKITALPSDFWSLGSLKEMDLSSNQISGFLANNIGNFAALEMLDLSGNSFSGEIPSALGSLTSLRILSLGGNEFEGSIPDGIVNCHSLVRVDLSFNKLDGALPDGLGVALPMLQELNVAGNSITGRGMDFLLMNSLTGLNISGNMFQGSVLSVFQETLKVIDLSRNQFQGHISQVQFNSAYDWSNLEYLDLSENDLSGEIIQQLNQAPNLKHLNIAFNRFSRQGFPEMDGLWNLEYLNMSRTGLTGHIPTDLSKMANLKALDLSMNHLTDQVPLLPVINLQVVDFSHNNLSGEIPVSLLKKLPYMERFNFSYNNFTFCTSDFSSETLQTHFIGSSNDCPIAVNPSLFRRKVTKHKELVLVLVLTTSVIFLLVVVLFLAFGFRRKSKLWTVKQTSCKEEQTIFGPFSFQTDSTTWVADVKQANSVRVVIFEKPLLNITFADLLSATSSFDRGTLLAEGKFGPVYRGFLPGGVQVAVKVLVHGSTLTDHEAARELEHLGRIKHLNLVPLTGYCIAGDQRFAIYDYMENGNLQNLLHDLPLGVQATEDWSNDTWEEEEDNNGIRSVGSEGSLITWRFRHKIALGTARALAFLHHGCSPPIIHRDVKASSVYLDYNLEPRLSDFGLAKVFGNGLDEEITRGSPGYVPPEFSDPDNNHPTTKSDVYCFGVVLFELLTGKKPVEDDYPDDRYSTLVSWVRGLVRNNQVSKAIDPKIIGTGSSKEMEETLKIGYLCTADLPSKRPSMQQIVGLLKDVEPTSARH